MPPDLYALLFTGLLAAGSGNPPPPEPADLEMLEFLGSFETRDGKWVDPLSLNDREPEKTKPAREEKRYE